jgi:hypothetical protein
LAALVAALRSAGSYNRQDQAPPAAVLWTDKQRQWESLIREVRSQIPIFTLGNYEPNMQSGPAYWLRCIVDRTIESIASKDETPVIYLPGVSRHMMRATESCPRELQPISELQFRGVLWTQKNSRDWTIAAFMQNSDVGLGLEVGTDNSSQDALKRSLPKLANQTLGTLRAEMPIRAPFLNNLLHPDEARSILDWLSDPQGFNSNSTSEEWWAFSELCQSRYGFDPEADGPLAATRLLGQRDNLWGSVWQRFEESPTRYAALPGMLRQARPTKLLPLVDHVDSWPQDNEQAEEMLRDGLAGAANLDANAARMKILVLDQEHCNRRTSVWATLNQAPLAASVAHLAQLALSCEQSLKGSTVQELVGSYSRDGFVVDWAALRALAEVSTPEDEEVVARVVRTLYRPWLEEGAHAFQAALTSDPTSYRATKPVVPASGTCFVFADGLRYDLAIELAKAIGSPAVKSTVDAALAALPTVTTTGKPAVSPAACSLRNDSPAAFEPTRAVNGSKVTTQSLRAGIEAAGVRVLSHEELGDPSGCSWTEFGAIDSRGHAQYAGFARGLSGEINRLAQRIRRLIRHGWQRVVVVTDHGWLLLPGGLPKIELPEHLTIIRKGRCALLKADATSAMPRFQWRWNPRVEFVTAPGIACFVAGRHYEHGGLSPQECIVPRVFVETSCANTAPLINQIVWRGMRCNVTIEHQELAKRVDIRTRAGDSSCSLVDGGKELKSNKSVALFVRDDDQEGVGAVVVVLGEDETVLAQASTIVGSG